MFPASNKDDGPLDTLERRRCLDINLLHGRYCAYVSMGCPLKFLTEK